MDLGFAVGDCRKLDYLFCAAYEELRRLAATVRRSDPSATLNPTALVNEAWLKPAKSPEIAVASRLHFKRNQLLENFNTKPAIELTGNPDWGRGCNSGAG